MLYFAGPITLGPCDVYVTSLGRIMFGFIAVMIAIIFAWLIKITSIRKDWLNQILGWLFLIISIGLVFVGLGVALFASSPSLGCEAEPSRINILAKVAIALPLTVFILVLSKSFQQQNK